MPNKTNTNKGIDRLATKTTMDHLMERSGMMPSERTTSRFDFAEQSKLSSNAPEFIPMSMMTNNTKSRKSRRNMMGGRRRKARRNTRRANRR